ncbi:hypothetical protein ACLIYP_10955 [Streptomyces nanhaiensis]|uniref:hypothetical protein n=1 Tax=Streptomyces nanhaiensis TaxID=679319 RepID=UPI00399D51FD
MPSPRHPGIASQSAEQHAHIARIDSAIITLVRRRMAAVAELEDLRRKGRAPRTELTRENAVFRQYETELGRLGAGLAMLLTRTAAAGKTPNGDGTGSVAPSRDALFEEGRAGRVRRGGGASAR